MVDAKFLEIRDAGTMIPVMAVKFWPDNDGRQIATPSDHKRRLIARAGYGVTVERQNACVFLCKLATGGSEYDPYKWGDRTMLVAHGYIEQNWPTLNDGAVVDVEFILEITKQPKTAEA